MGQLRTQQTLHELQLHEAWSLGHQWIYGESTYPFPEARTPPEIYGLMIRALLTIGVG